MDWLASKSLLSAKGDMQIKENSPKIRANRDTDNVLRCCIRD